MLHAIAWQWRASSLKNKISHIYYSGFPSSHRNKNKIKHLNAIKNPEIMIPRTAKNHLTTAADEESAFWWRQAVSFFFFSFFKTGSVLI